MKIKKIISVFLFLFVILSGSSKAAPVFNAPAVRLQPNGDTLHCLLSGDEYYHRLHDANGYTIVQHPRTGYWVYADTLHLDPTHWEVVATDYVAGRVDPASVGLNPNVGVDVDTWNKLQHRLDVPDEKHGGAPKTSGRNHGVINNIVIFIRFSDETEISTSLSTINGMFNDSSATSTSMYNYFKKASYGKLYIPTSYFPAPNGNTVVSYQDSLPRSYYMPYNSSTNPNGYVDDADSRNREFSLLERAVNYVNANSPVPTSLNIDMDNDGKVDNICFVVKGTYTGWSELLWPHKWSLYDRYVYINGKRVYTFNLQLEGSGSHYFSSSTFCHEMFHTLGAPDLYRYNNHTDVSGVGSWDLMCSNTTPPQHMSAYMKWKYGNWLDSIPEITVPGTYTLHSLADADYDNCAYKIAAQEPHQWYVLEYRDNTEMFETALSGRGLLIFRIDDRYNGNASFDGVSVFDEVYLFRPGGYNDTVNGTTSQAYFSGNTSRTTFSPSTNPYPWLTGNVIDTTISITNVTSPGVTISFTYNDLRGCRIPDGLYVNNVMGHSAVLHWAGNSPQYAVQWRQGTSGAVQTASVNGTSFSLDNLSLNTEYQWRVRGICGVGDSTIYSNWSTLHTTECPVPETTTIGAADTTLYFLPFNTYYNYSYTQMLYDPSDVGGEMNISKLSFNYAYSNPTETKNNCIVYMGNTTQTSFSGTSMSHFVPFSQLQKVYEGPLNCVQGWNTIDLDTVFHYNGTGSLVVAIDDNSGDYDGSSYKFYCSNTGNAYKSLTYYSDNVNIDPTASSSSGSKSRKMQRAQLRFDGCPVVPMYHVSVAVAGNEGGTVTGSGDYAMGETATIEATPEEGFNFLYWTSAGDTLATNPYSFVVTANVTYTAHFQQAYHTVTVVSADETMGQVSGGGVLPTGSLATLTATPVEHHHFLYWLSNGETLTDNLYNYVVTSDRTFTAYFAIDKFQLSVQSSDTALGRAWFQMRNNPEHFQSAELDHGTPVWLYAEPRTDVPGFAVQFDGWSDGVTASVRSFVMDADTALTAYFSATPVSIANSEAIQVATQGLSVMVRGAAGRSVRLFDLKGRCLYSVIASDPQWFTVQTSGVYLLSVEGFPVRKVVLIR